MTSESQAFEVTGKNNAQMVRAGYSKIVEIKAVKYFDCEGKIYDEHVFLKTECGATLGRMLYRGERIEDVVKSYASRGYSDDESFMITSCP